MQILHLSADYPDPINPSKTRAIHNLLALQPEHQHLVYSLNRTAWHHPLTCLGFADPTGDAHTAIRYPALPKGLLHRRYLLKLAQHIWLDLQRRGICPDAVHAHKLTVEGIAGRWLADRLGVPLIVSVQGNTDLKIATAKPDLRAEYRRIWHDAAVALPFAPWAREGLDALLGTRNGWTRCMPCPGPQDHIIAPIKTGPVIRTAFHLDHYRNKNAVRLFRAISLLAQRHPQVRLEVLGSGDASALSMLREAANRCAPGRVIFRGAIPHNQMQQVLNESAAFALVSHRESYGMVFAEALLAGVPCLIPQGQAIDGYLPEGEITLTAAPNSTVSIANGLSQLLTQQSAFKARLARRQDTGQLDFLRRPAIARTYADALEHVAPHRSAHANGKIAPVPEPA